jgi:anti-anti-sigma factor
MAMTLPHRLHATARIPLGVEGTHAQLVVDDDRVVVMLGGELDIASTPALRQLLRSALEADADVVVDLGAVTFLDASTIDVFVSLGVRHLWHAQPFVARVLGLCGLATLTLA